MQQYQVCSIFVQVNCSEGSVVNRFGAVEICKFSSPFFLKQFPAITFLILASVFSIRFAKVPAVLRFGSFHRYSADIST
jgi:hypothetical protein